MTDELLLRRLRDPAFGTETSERNLMSSAADRIEALTAEYEEAMECNEQFFVDNEFLKKRVTALTAERDEMAMSCLSADGEAQRAWDAQKAAEAERDRLRHAIRFWLEAEEPDVDAAINMMRAALKGETP